MHNMRTVIDNTNVLANIRAMSGKFQTFHFSPLFQTISLVVHIAEIALKSNKLEYGDKIEKSKIIWQFTLRGLPKYYLEC